MKAYLSNPKSKDHENGVFEKHFLFTNKYLVRRKIFLHFQKCQSHSCTHCYSNSPQNSCIRDVLEDFDRSIPFPVFTQDINHYPTLIQLFNDQEIKKLYKEKLSSIKRDCCDYSEYNWDFLNQADKKKHL